ncbi:MAG TPA: hypothetical protein VI583_03770 [Cyclobacteriaceae bacterium]|nr:hypothetical protein [Cyclobacteriaceae bacterium]
MAGCLRKMACPAYQSQFLLADEAFHSRFTLFNPDSTPKDIGKVKKNKHGTYEGISYSRKNVEMKNVPMIKIYPLIPDSLLMAMPSDSLGGDSTRTGYESKLMTVVNNDQLIYNYLYGSLLVKNDSKELTEDLIKVDQDSSGTSQDDSQIKRSKFKLFKKKQETGKESGTEPANTQPANADPANTQPANSEPTNAEPENVQPANTEPDDDGF